MSRSLHLIFILLLSLSIVACSSDDDDDTANDDDTAPRPMSWTLSDPDGSLTVNLDLSDDGELSWSVEREGRTVLEPAPLGLETDARGYATGLVYVAETEREILDAYAMPHGKTKNRRHRANELELGLECACGKPINVIARAATDGVALRYCLTDEGPLTIEEEQTGFAIPASATGWGMHYDPPTPWTPAYEKNPVTMAVGEESAGAGWGFPLLWGIDQDWVLLSEAHISADNAGAHLTDPEGNLYSIAYPNPGEGNNIGEALPRAEQPFCTPWRVAIIGDLDDVFSSTLIEDLNPPADERFNNWPEPVPHRRAAWSWFSENTGDPALQRKYIDLAAGLGWEYNLIDANWDEWPNAYEELAALVQYGYEREVEMLLWYNSGGAHNVVGEGPRDLMLDPEVRRAELERIAGIGIAGIKVDFFQSDKQDRMQQYIGILEDAADTGLLVNFHGCTLPRGWARTYPNLMTMEAVRGAEMYRSPFGPDAIHNVRLALTRNIVGSMDYTPVTFSEGLESHSITYAHQIALPVVFESGIQHLADQAEDFQEVMEALPGVRTFLELVPTAWEESRLVAADPDRYVIVARRAATHWWVAGISGDEPVELRLPLEEIIPTKPECSYGSFRLNSGPSPVLVEGTNAGAIQPSDEVDLSLKSSDGFVMWFSADPPGCDPF